MSSRALGSLLATGVAITVACHAAPAAHVAAVARTPLAATGALVAAIEHAGALYLFAPDHLTIERSGAATATVPAPDGAWADAITMPALDDTGTWVVARTAHGSLWRITAGGELEPIHDLLGVGPHVRALAGGPGTVVLALDDGIAILRDRAHIARFAAEPAAAQAPEPSVLAGRDRIAIRRGATLDVWDLATRRHAGYRVPGLLGAGFLTGEPAGPGRLIAATRDAIFLETDGALRRIAAPAAIASLAVAGSRAWVATAAGVFLVDGGEFVRARVQAAATDHLFGLADGDLVLGSATATARLTLDRPADDPRWAAEVAPIFRRVCARCHNPDGDAGVDLSTPAAWRIEHTELVHRVIDARTMPPAGTPIDDADRRTLERWLAR